MSVKRYTDEFKIEAVRQIVEYGRPMTELAERLGVSVNAADDAAPFPSNETATTAARVRARRLHLDTGIPAEVHAPNRNGDADCLIRYLRPDQLVDLCGSQAKWHAAFVRPLFETARGLSLIQQDGHRRR